MFSEVFEAQLRVLMGVLPELREGGPLALKGGTALNLFVHDLPRLSVDLDLTYLPLNGREKALNEIDAELKAIRGRLERRGYAVQGVPLRGTAGLVKLNVRSQAGVTLQGVTVQGVTVKLEVSPVLRGTVFAPALLEVRPAVQERYGYARTPVVSLHDLYAGKLMAALDRQHPRDLFDVLEIRSRGPVSRETVQALLVYLISHDRPLAEVLLPHLRDLDSDYHNHFMGMTVQPTPLENLLEVRSWLVAQLPLWLTARDRAFLRSFKRREPDWTLLEVAHAAELPAVRWKMHNLSQMAPAKHREAVERLERLLDSWE